MSGRVLINVSVQDARSLDVALSERIAYLIRKGDISTSEVDALYNIQKRLAPRIQTASQTGRTSMAVAW